ncbi:MAG: Gfo/Idh/MocA family oxidoreductase [Pirellulales bacterium]|nr:Gfo/Idh/MocA family oxidoreductase [Pirellulales bacterium]
MSRISRRGFLQASTGAALATAAGATLGQPRAARAVSANDKIVLGVIGLRGRGSALAPDFAKRPDCEVAYVCDCDTQWLGPRAAAVEAAQGRAPKQEQDFRRVLDDKSVDAVVLATPDHWHALGTILACQAGKDVYVEKPASHSPWEGRKMVEAARKYQRIVQLGTQNRSAPYNHSAKEYLDSGKLGRIHYVKVFNQKSWSNVQPVDDSAVPSTLDYDLWCGPAPQLNFNANYVNAWNHFWRYSGGDIINDGVHQMDLARWMIDRDYPKSVYSIGGRYDEPGALETPDTQTAIFEYDHLILAFELTLYTPYMIKSDMELRNSQELYPYWPQNAERIEIYGSEGLMYLGRHGCGWQVYGRQQKRQPQVVAQDNGPFPDPEHKENFCQSIRSRELPSADIEKGHKSTLLCQLANVSLRLGGEKLVVDPQTETCVGNDRANALLKREYRSPWIVPETV